MSRTSRQRYHHRGALMCCSPGVLFSSIYIPAGLACASRTGVLPADKELAKWMRKTIQAPVVLAANKCERRGVGTEAGLPAVLRLWMAALWVGNRVR